MFANDRKRYGIMMARLGHMHNREVSSVMLEEYWNALAGYSIERVERAVEWHKANNKFFPKPSEIKEVIQGSWPETSYVYLPEPDPSEETRQFGRACNRWVQSDAFKKFPSDYGAWREFMISQGIPEEKIPSETNWIGEK